ncbi:MAG: hypothetical protein IJS91_01600 [Bacteroidales bacterium]|nr:hypothetical protein [Bacteroidales bacterium]
MNRRLIALPALLATLFLATGCPDTPPIEPESADHFEASLEALEGYGKPAWPKEAVIRIVPEGTSQDFRIPFAGSLAVDGSLASFRADNYKDYEKACLALWPENLTVVRDGENLSVGLPQIRYNEEGGFNLQDMPMVALGGADARLNFHHLCNVVEVSYDAARPIREIQLRSKKDEALWGEAIVTLSEAGVPTHVICENTAEDRNILILRLCDDEAGEPGTEPFVTGGNSTVTSGILNGSQLPGRRSCCFIVPPEALGAGFVLTILDEGFGYMQQEEEAPGAGRARYVAFDPVNYKDASEEVTIREDVLNKAFYKDLFLNSGMFLTTNDTLPVSDFLGLEIEHMMIARSNPTAADYAAQTAMVAGSNEDTNGRLLYPDGEPRYRMVYVRGGGSSDHGYSLGPDGRDRFRAFVAQGGSYLGSCAGAYVATRGTSLNGTTSGNYMGIWPGHCNSLSTKQIYPGHVLPTDSPLLQYYDFGGDYYIDSVRHHNGPCFINYDCVPGTEVLTRFDIPDSTKMHGHPAIIAWKQDKWTGRVIPCGSHPEQVPSGENLLLMAAMVRYCFDGLGIAKVKGILHNGETRRMTCTTEDQKPAYTRIGDRQCHHFVFALPDGARNVRVRLASLEGYQLSLRLAKGTFAFKEDAQYALENTEPWKELYWPTLEAGTWYVGVQCESVPTVVTNHGKFGTEYADTGVLNGAPYTISVSWEY